MYMNDSATRALGGKDRMCMNDSATRALGGKDRMYMNDSPTCEWICLQQERREERTEFIYE